MSGPGPLKLRRLAASALVAAATLLAGSPAAGRSPARAPVLAVTPLRQLFPADEVVRGLGRAGTDLSAVAVLEGPGGPWLVLAPDEGTTVALASLDGGVVTSVDLQRLFDLPPPAPGELDLEGAAADGPSLWFTGSCSLTRRAADPDATDGANRSRLATVRPAAGPGRHDADVLWRVDALTDGSGGLTLVPGARIDLRLALTAAPGLSSLLLPSMGIPSKEGGLDVEGLEVAGSTVWLGLRGPQLRGHAVVVRLELSPGRDGVAAVSYRLLDLGGLGIRGMCRAAPEGEAPGLYLLAGPTMAGDDDGPFAIHRWNGESDCFVGQDRPAVLSLVGRILPPGSARPEGLTALRCADGTERLLVVFDGPEGGAPGLLRPLALPRR